jgi:hypothetical protein
MIVYYGKAHTGIAGKQDSGGRSVDEQHCMAGKHWIFGVDPVTSDNESSYRSTRKKKATWNRERENGAEEL